MGIPSNWVQNRNDLVISNFKLGDKKEWSFEVYIEDDGKNFLRQTIKLVFVGFSVELLPITLPLTGNLSIILKKYRWPKDQRKSNLRRI